MISQTGYPEAKFREVMKCEEAIEHVRIHHKINTENPQFTYLFSENQEYAMHKSAKEIGEMPKFISPNSDPSLLKYYLDEFDPAT